MIRYRLSELWGWYRHARSFRKGRREAFRYACEVVTGDIEAGR